VSDPADLADARAVFGDALPQARQFADILATEGVLRGVIGPREANRLWDRHLVNCAALAEAVEPGALVFDVGSGAGLPGVVLAVQRPDVRVVLLEPLQRRVDFLLYVVAALGLDNVEVSRTRAQDSGGNGSADVVTARAVAPLDRLVRMCVPLLRPGGRLLALKGARAEAELAAATPALRALGTTGAVIVQMGLDVLEKPTTVVVVTAGAPAKGTSTVRPSRRKGSP
jgi:16S rRNA (guanine527-N7)-methyltransferase